MNSLIKSLYKITLPLLLAGCVAETTPVTYQPTSTPKREETRIAEVTPIPIYTPTPARPRIAEFMDEMRKYSALFEKALEIKHYTNDELDFHDLSSSYYDELSSSYICLNRPRDWNPSGDWNPPNGWDEVNSCLSQVEGALSNLMQRISDAGLLPIINPGFQENIFGIQEAIQELGRYTRYEDPYKYDEKIDYEFYNPYGKNRFDVLSNTINRLPQHIIGYGDERLNGLIFTDFFNNFFRGKSGCWCPWYISGPVENFIQERGQKRNIWIYNQILKNESNQLKDYLYGEIVYDYSLMAFEFYNPAEAESALQRLYSTVKVDDIPVVVDGKEFTMIYWKEPWPDGNQNMYALTARQDEFLFIINPNTEIKDENDLVALLVAKELLT